MYTSRSFHNLYATVPTWLVKDMKALLSPFIKLLCNKSLAVGCFPSDFKRAVVRPLLKKGRLDTSQMNYRPVSNLSFLFKSLERVVQRRLQEFLNSNNLMPETVSLSPVSQHRNGCDEGL